MPAKGLPKNLALTLWLIAPLGVVALLCWWIFHSFAAGPAMNAPARGQGAGDTGGANALGEFLAGNDPNEVQRQNRLLREGKLVHPADWPGGVRLVLAAPQDMEMAPPFVVYTFEDDRPTWNVELERMEPLEAGFSLDIRPGRLDRNQPIFIGERVTTSGIRHTERTETVGGSVRPSATAPMLFASGENDIPLASFTLRPVPPGDTPEDEPLVIDVANLGFMLSHVDRGRFFTDGGQQDPQWDGPVKFVLDADAIGTLTPIVIYISPTEKNSMNAPQRSMRPGDGRWELSVDAGEIDASYPVYLAYPVDRKINMLLAQPGNRYIVGPTEDTRFPSVRVVPGDPPPAEGEPLIIDLTPLARLLPEGSTP